MLSSNKLIALKMFIHSRMTGKFTVPVKQENDENLGIVIADKDKCSKVNEDIKAIERNLRLEGYTVERLKNMPNSYITSLIYDYYMVLLKEYEKLIFVDKENPENNLVIDGVIGLSMLSTIYDEKGISDGSGFKYMDVLEAFENKEKNNNREMVFKMHEVARKLMEKIDKYEFKVKRKSKSGKKK